MAERIDAVIMVCINMSALYLVGLFLIDAYFARREEHLKKMFTTEKGKS